MKQLIKLIVVLTVGQFLLMGIGGDGDPHVQQAFLGAIAGALGVAKAGIGLYKSLKGGGAKKAAGAVGKATGLTPADLPDFRSTSLSSGTQARNDILEAQEKSLEQIKEAGLSRGLTGASSIERTISASSDAIQDIDAKIADSVAEASNREEEIRFREEKARQQARAKQTGGLLKGIGGFLAKKTGILGKVGGVVSGVLGGNPVEAAASLVSDAPQTV